MADLSLKSLLTWAGKKEASPYERQQRKDYEPQKYEAGLASNAASKVSTAQNHEKAARMHNEAARKAVDLKDKQAHAAKAQEHQSRADEIKRDEQGRFA